MESAWDQAIGTNAPFGGGPEFGIVLGILFCVVAWPVYKFQEWRDDRREERKSPEQRRRERESRAAVIERNEADLVRMRAELEVQRRADHAAAVEAAKAENAKWQRRYRKVGLRVDEDGNFKRISPP